MQKMLFSEIDRLYTEYLDILEDICNIESPTDFKSGVDAVGRYCADIADRLGFSVRTFAHEISGDTFLITMNDTAEGAPVVLSAHMDTVHPIGAFGTPAVRRDSENMYGPGVMDCKGGIAAALLAMHALKNIGFKNRPIKLFLQSDEENSSRTSNKKTVAEMCEAGRGAVCFLNLEGYVAGTAVTERKGIIRYRFDVHGMAIHAARCAYGKNAIAEAAAKILELEKMKDVDGLTCSCDIISGGTALNSVPENCSFSVDIRFANTEELERARETVRRVADTNFFVDGCSCDITELSVRSAMPRSEANLALLERINEIYEEMSMPTLKARFCVSGSDAAYITAAGIPCIDCIGTEGGNIHSTREFVKLASLSESAKRIASVALCI